MTMRLTCSRVITAVEESIQPVTTFELVVSMSDLFLLPLRSFVRADTRECRLEIDLLKNMGLGLEGRRHQDEVLRNNGKLVEHEEMGRSNVRNADPRRRILERVEDIVRLCRVMRGSLGLTRQGRRVTKLKL